MRTAEQKTSLFHKLHEHYSRMGMMYYAGSRHRFNSRGCVRHVRHMMRNTVN